jgi:hypothetical protein
MLTNPPERIWKLRVPGFYLLVEFAENKYSWQWYYLDDFEYSHFHLCDSFLEAVTEACKYYPVEKPNPDRISEDMKEARKKYEEALELLSRCIF